MNSHKDETPVTRRHIAELSAGLITKYYGNNYLPYPEAPDDDHRNKSNIYAVISRNPVFSTRNRLSGKAINNTNKLPRCKH